MLLTNCNLLNSNLLVYLVEYKQNLLKGQKVKIKLKKKEKTEMYKEVIR